MNMAIEKNTFKGTNKFDSEFSSPNSRDELVLSSDDADELLERRNAVVESELEEDEEEQDEEEEDDEFNDVDSGAGSDDFDLLELGETGAEFCQVGDSTCSVPFELYDLSGLEDILSVDVWNEVLCEEDRVELTKFLPDMDQFTFMRTLKELFEGGNLHFGSPIKKLFEMLKGGLCEPRVALYKEGLNFFQKRLHYHKLRKYHNSMVSNFCLARDAWVNCRGYSIHEKIRVLNFMKSQKSLMHDKMEEDLESNSSEKEESGDVLWGKRVKDRRSASKLARNSPYGPSSNFELPLAKSIGLDMKKYGKQNSKGILKSAGSKALPNEVLERFPSVYHSLDGPYGPAVPISRQTKVMGYDSGSFGRRDQMRFMHDEDYEDNDDRGTCEMGVQQDRNVFGGSAMDKSGFHKAGKKNELLRSDELAADSFVGLPLSSRTDLHAYSRNKIAKEMSEMKKFTSSHDYARKAKYPENYNQLVGGEQMKPVKSRSMQPSLKGSQVDLSDPTEPIWLRNSQGQVFGMAPPFKSDEWNMRSKKWKKDRESPDLNFISSRASPSQIDDRILLSDLRAKSSQGKIKSNYFQNGGSNKGGPKAKRMYTKADETESDSSEQYVDDEEEDASLLMRSAYPGVPMQGSHNFMLQSGLNSKNTFMRRDMQENVLTLEGMAHLPKRMGAHIEHGLTPGYLSKAKQKSRVRDRSPFELGMKAFDETSPLSLRQLKDEVDRKRLQKLAKNGQLLGEPGQRLNRSSLKAYASGRKQKGEIDHEYYMEDDSFETRLLSDENALARLGKKGKSIDAYVHDQRDRSEASILGCNSGSKKRKAKEDAVDMDMRDANGNMLSNIQPEFDGSISLRKKGKRKLEAVRGTLDVDMSEPPVAETKAVEIEPEPKPQKKPYTPITPTVHTGFSFSIIHLLSAVRMAMITPLPEESMEVEKPKEDQQGENEGGTDAVVSNENVDVNKSENAEKKNVPSLTVQEIVNRVKSNPGDPCILETQEPLQDLVRGLLKIFSSKTAPLGAKGWKALVVYEKPTKSWSWIGPVSNTTDSETIEEVTSPEYWGLPHKMLVKLVDSFAIWLKSGQETLQQIGSLPAPPLSLMQCNLDEKDRFRDLRAQKSLSTISPSSEEVREYFRKEEVLRYSIPDRAFSYTAADGKKSIVAPLRRCGGKPTSKARDHFMLKRDRPPHVTILCLVRDAAARLPGSIGTRADVCTLIRDSQYIVEDVSDEKVNQVVSGALDRLHYERDPCVQFDGERKLWVYLHREREEEDFEDDGTSSTKKWKRQKKDPAEQPEQPEQGTVTVAFHAEPPGDNAGFDLGSDLNAEPPGAADNKRTDLASNAADDKRIGVVNNDAKQSMEGNTESSLGPEQGNTESSLGPEQGNAEKSGVGLEQGNTEIRMGPKQGNTDQGDPMAWDALSMNSTEENKLLCQQNSTNEDFDDETFGRERPVGLLGAS